MLDIKFVRDNPDAVKENIKKKFQDAKLPLVDEVLELDEKKRAAITEARELRAQRNTLSKQVGMLMGQAKKDPSKLEEAEAIKAKVKAQAERLAELETVVRQGGSDDGAPLILSTIHSSKGLEYERVILMDVADGIFPKSLPDKAASQEEKDAYEEERRLFYVGMTRARESLAVITFLSLIHI